MLLKDSIEQAFGYDAEERIFHFLVKDELSDCGGDTARWLRLFEKCETWRKQFLLWENGTYINGVHGWNLEINICSFAVFFPQSQDAYNRIWKVDGGRECS